MSFSKPIYRYYRVSKTKSWERNPGKGVDNGKADADIFTRDIQED